MMEKVFVDMINIHRGIIYKVCNLYAHHPEDKKDLFQEIVLQLWKSFPSFRAESKPSTWMYRVALNTAITVFRKERKMPERKDLSADEFQIPDVSDFAAADEQMSQLKRAIRLLSEIERAVILLYLEDKNYEEISEIIGISKVNVGVRINRIKIKLEKIIKSDRYELR
ncbi:RNA polymerase sigma factor [Pedobacter sp. MC2016-24]|uniref:RNA polymerase sigma factor n=1 Tax=Pedobacter sp. MC2016-24 TaxID=2780090 RepID=UPI001D16A288|nr:sigma-70 family RNA polymerase sigma factor [Pedobacter sp. MC2016-24]